MTRIVVLGGGESGTGSAVLAKQQGFDTFLSDKGEIAEGYRKILDDHDVPYEEGLHTEEKILSADRIIKSPGIPDSSPLMVKIREQGIPVVSEIEFAGEYTDAKTICVTGSNGKTTTTTLIYGILLQAGYKVGLAGNIGESFALSVAHDDYDWYVLELSSFQLDGMEKFRADTAILMNITPDHLDRYGYNLQNYVDSKFRVIRNQRPEDTFIYCQDDPITIENIGKYDLGMKVRPFSARAKEGTAARIVNGIIEIYSEGKHLSIPLCDLQVRGIHNSYNVMAAALAALSAGVDTEVIYNSLVTFTGVEHRLELVGYVDDVLYINDSKATNVDSAWYALESMNKPVVWIAGGTDKGNDYTKLYDIASGKVKALICMGVDNSKLVAAFTGRVPKVLDTHSLNEAMTAAQGEAEAGDVVLLSPACASFDLFRNYEDRGRQFKHWVEEKGNKDYKLRRYMIFIVIFIVCVPLAYAAVSKLMGSEVNFLELLRKWFDGLSFVVLVAIGTALFFADDLLRTFKKKKTDGK